MQISLRWVNELVNIETVNLDDLIEKLTLGGFEVEEIFELEINNKKEIALDISATANRSDSLSIQGISNEIATLLNKSLQPAKYSIPDLSWKSDIENLSLRIQDEQNSSAFIGMTVENLNDLTVPKWIKDKLLSSGITPTNNLLDFQNYILLETGYPFEFYDLDKIRSRLNGSKFHLTIESATKNEEFLASNDTNYSLNESISIIKANELAISIAGIISKKDFSYSETTTALLIEGSIFNSTKIRQQSRTLGLRTDRSARYEKSLKNTNLLESFYKLIYLLRIANPTLTCKLHTIQESLKHKSEPILLQYKTIKEILGPIKKDSKKNIYIQPDLITNYLDRLNFDYSYSELELVWKVNIPYLRSDDITREIDLVEEIGRLHGFNNFVSRLPKLQRIGYEDSSYQTRKKIISSFLNLGFNELIHYSLVKEKTFTTNEIKLVNPLITDYSNLRSTLLPSIIQTVQENFKQGNPLIEGFEFGHVFSGDSINNLKEKEHLAGVFGGIDRKSTWSESVQPLTWFEAKGKLEQFFKQLNLVPQWKTFELSDDNEVYHPYCTAQLYLDNKIELGKFGKIHPILAKQLNLPSNLYLFEFHFESIRNQIQRNQLKMYQNYSSYPKVVKDLSFIIHEDISFEKIEELLYFNGTKFLSTINLLDEYKGESIPENHISLCLQLTFQSNEKTLQNKEIESTINNLQLLLTNKLDAKIRR
uniref:Phenylalanine--tRNA ligase beta subunit, chloroplastic n=1 Tax=Seminavis robusta TaxID=568900 RepID=A0A3S8PZQ9_9STRA|nr:phenylalanine tRNA synthetase beta chain [Seminavis robusta]|eukprot:Sro51_chlor_g029430.1 syfB (706) ;mRNA; r:16182-18299